MRNSKAVAEQTKTSLLDAAERLFWERGAARTSIMDIARQAGVTRGAFYHHFRDKRAVLVALIERVHFLQDQAVLQRAAEQKLDGIATLRTWCREVFEFFVVDQTRQRMFGIIMHGQESLGDLYDLAEGHRSELFRSHETFEVLLKRVRREKRLAATWTPATAAIALQSMMYGLIDQGVRRTDRSDFRPTALACIDRLLDSFARDSTVRKRA